MSLIVHPEPELASMEQLLNVRSPVMDDVEARHLFQLSAWGEIQRKASHPLPSV